MEPIIVFKDITKTFPGVVALDGVNFSIHKGEVHAVVGENGAGKTTLMNILGGEIQPDGGEVIFRAASVSIPNPHAARLLGISIVYQDLKLCPNLSVVENMYLGREGSRGKINWRKLSIVATDVIQSLGVEINPRKLVRTLSIAEQQLVEIAKAISWNAEVLIMDEPTSALTLNRPREKTRKIKLLRRPGNIRMRRTRP